MDEILNLQSGIALSEQELSNDEVMFIAIHQIDELWMKLVIRELVYCRDIMMAPKIAEVNLQLLVRSLHRAGEVLGQLSQHFSLMETMTTRDYLGFRDKLSPASGFQSGQLREIEILLGLDDAIRLTTHDYKKALREPDGKPTQSLLKIEARQQEPNLKQVFEKWLYRTPIKGSTPEMPDDAKRVQDFVQAYLTQMGHEPMTNVVSARAFLEAHDVSEGDRHKVSRVRAAILFIESYRELPLLTWPRELLEAILQLEQRMVIFRQRHARMVERIIGRRIGTGASAGVDYLDQTALKYRIYHDLWAVRTILIRKEALPPIENTGEYTLA